QIIEGGELFSEEKNIFIENFFTKKKSQLLIKEITSYLSEHINDANTVLWEGKELSAAQVNLFPKALVQAFKLPQVLFSFLNQFLLLTPQDRVTAFHEAVQNLEPDLVFFMMIRQIRLL